MDSPTKSPLAIKSSSFPSLFESPRSFTILFLFLEKLNPKFHWKSLSLKISALTANSIPLLLIFPMLEGIVEKPVIVGMLTFHNRLVVLVL